MNRSTAIATILVLLTSLAAPAGAAAPRDTSAWKNATPEQPDAVLVQGATIWTSGSEGVLEDTDLLIRKGKIARIGKGLRAPRGAVVIDGSGKHVTAGLIDAHNHSAIVGGVNEGSNITTAEVRIGDVVNSDSIQVYRQLAGGLTTANLLHGSANSIGGQNAVIKLRWGALPEEMKFEGAPGGIKFALGENPKQSNFNNDNPRYPRTRAGVERSIRERFEAARDYRDARAAHEKDSSRVPPRRDLQLDALVEIMDGERLVHSHSYRADEIVMLLRLAEDFGFTISSFQHVLEGYKVADELAAGKAGASTFSDWWAYKFEVIDAIPYNGAIMWDRGVVVSFNSDSSDLARRLNTEAAKAVRYGGVPEAEALKFVTLNPAIQLGIDDRVGSLEKGKDADFVIWSGHPLSTYTICEQTWIDGRKYFDREDDLIAREAIAAERQELLAKVRAEAEKEEEEDKEDEDEGEDKAEEEPEEAR
ncbi:MAG: hypothetical protein E2P01_08275 [Acidobacteria bacterium]|nr:MAG: hypothetical protein E2P01_08275 [Acidobacteriota bacterium]